MGAYVPIVVFVPLTLAWCGATETQKITFLFIGCFVALLPMVFIAVTTQYAGWRSIFDNFLPLRSQPGKGFIGTVNVALTVIIMLCALLVMVECLRRAYRVLVQGRYTRHGQPVRRSDPGFQPPDFGEA